jgi:hypothetical protein
VPLFKNLTTKTLVDDSTHPQPSGDIMKSRKRTPFLTSAIATGLLLFSLGAQAAGAFWTQDNLSVRYGGKVTVLTSSDTFSGGEECAYDFQTHQRGTIVGETTGGGAVLSHLTASKTDWWPRSRLVGQ